MTRLTVRSPAAVGLAGGLAAAMGCATGRLRRGRTGGAAAVLGLAWIGVGLFLHFHFFFGLHPRLNEHSRTANAAALALACAGFTLATAWSSFAASSAVL